MSEKAPSAMNGAAAVHTATTFIATIVSAQVPQPFQRKLSIGGFKDMYAYIFASSGKSGFPGMKMSRSAFGTMMHEKKLTMYLVMKRYVNMMSGGCGRRGR